MNEYTELFKAAGNFGVAGLLIAAACWGAIKFGGPLVAAQQKQAGALEKLAAAVKEGEGEQRELLLACRVMGTKLDELQNWARQLDVDVRALNGGSR